MAAIRVVHPIGYRIAVCGAKTWARTATRPGRVPQPISQATSRPPAPKKSSLPLHRLPYIVPRVRGVLPVYKVYQSLGNPVTKVLHVKGNVKMLSSELVRFLGNGTLLKSGDDFLVLDGDYVGAIRGFLERRGM